MPSLPAACCGQNNCHVGSGKRDSLAASALQGNSNWIDINQHGLPLCKGKTQQQFSRACQCIALEPIRVATVREGEAVMRTDVAYTTCREEKCREAMPHKIYPAYTLLRSAAGVPHH